MGTGTLTLNTGGGRVMPTERLIGAIEQFKATCVVGMPGLLLSPAAARGVRGPRLLDRPQDRARRGKRPGRIQAEDRRHDAARRSKRRRVASVLGFTESRMCWTECARAKRTGFHTYPDLSGSSRSWIRPTAVPLGEGETGELVYTGIDGRGSVVCVIARATSSRAASSSRSLVPDAAAACRASCRTFSASRT